MNEAERELVEAACLLTEFRSSHPASRAFFIAQRKVGRERLESEVPGWEEQFRTLLRASQMADAKWCRLSTRVRLALGQEEFERLVGEHQLPSEEYPK